MSVADSSISFEGMQRLTESMVFSVVERYLPLIFDVDQNAVKEGFTISGRLLGPDFIVTLPDSTHAIVEVEAEAPNTQIRLYAAADQLLAYSQAIEADLALDVSQRVLIVIGAISQEHVDQLRELGIDRVIDSAELQRIAEAARPPVGATNSTAAESDPVVPATSDELLRGLTDVLPGRAHWPQYQRLVGNMLEYLFCPPLSIPLPELSNQTKTNRRDFILPNYDTAGYWSFLRAHYDAHFVVADAKNLGRGVKKGEILQIANYLSVHGVGLFGIVAARQGCANSGEITQREQWVIHKKLIIVLDDSDFRQMLAMHASGGDPSGLIRQKIEDFRLSF